MKRVKAESFMNCVFLPSQVFLRESLEQRLEKQREVEVLKAAMIIQAHVLGYVARYALHMFTHKLKAFIHIK